MRLPTGEVIVMHKTKKLFKMEVPNPFTMMQMYKRIGRRLAGPTGQVAFKLRLVWGNPRIAAFRPPFNAPPGKVNHKESYTRQHAAKPNSRKHILFKGGPKPMVAFVTYIWKGNKVRGTYFLYGPDKAAFINDHTLPRLQQNVSAASSYGTYNAAKAKEVTRLTNIMASFPWRTYPLSSDPLRTNIIQKLRNAGRYNESRNSAASNTALLNKLLQVNSGLHKNLSFDINKPSEKRAIVQLAKYRSTPIRMAQYYSKRRESLGLPPKK